MSAAPRSDLSTQLDAIGEAARASIGDKHRARERALALSREVIRNSANAIRAVHRHDFDRAATLIAEATDRAAAAREALTGHADIYHAGFLHDAVKELAEAQITFALVQRRPLPTPAELGIEYPAYLNGLAESVGELRRYLLDKLRGGNIDDCERMLEAMDEIYALLVTIDAPDALTGGLRRTTDVTRGILERTRADLTLAVIQHNLIRRLDPPASA